jgi:hypothetical protein
MVWLYSPDWPGTHTSCLSLLGTEITGVYQHGGFRIFFQLFFDSRLFESVDQIWNSRKYGTQENGGLSVLISYEKMSKLTVENPDRYHLNQVAKVNVISIRYKDTSDPLMRPQRSSAEFLPEVQLNHKNRTHPTKHSPQKLFRSQILEDKD